MHFAAKRINTLFALLCGALFLIACSDSSTEPGETQSTGTSSSVDSDTEGSMTDNGDQPDPGMTVADPLIPNSARVDFSITVPAYQSDELQLQLSWGDKNFAATWVGDEFWSASEEFQMDTEHVLNATFSDMFGAITLGSYEQLFRTGTNTSELFNITADQFNTQKWDDDGDGVSNLDELIANTEPAQSVRVLLFSETKGFRHSSIADALRVLEELTASAGIQTDLAGDSSGVFTDENLARYNAVAWVLTSGDVLDDQEQAAFERYIRAGGGYAGIHSASDTEYDWPWYGALVGAYFMRHPEIQSATQFVEDQSHPSTRHLGSSWTRTDEWYDFQTNPRSQVNVLLRLDEGSYSGGGMGEDHPAAWYHEFDGGRSWYTGGGHTSASYDEPQFRAHLLGGLRYAAGARE
ncbi:MAG: ThuA domain-containing protein [Granulosicoccus sp.]|nr:ThuA domain-containing protein [Granulosicoccus sp.]